MNPTDKKVVTCAYLDGGMTPDECKWWDQEIQDDLETHAYMAEIRRFKESVAKLPPPELSRPMESYWGDFLAEARKPRPETLYERFARWTREHDFGPALAAATVVVFLLSVFALREGPPIHRMVAQWGATPAASPHAGAEAPAPTEVLDLRAGRPAIDVSHYTDAGASVIWMSGIEYRPAEEEVR